MERKHENVHTNVKDIVEVGLMAAIIYVCTALVNIPTPTRGYVNFGDGMVLMSAYIFSKKKSVLSSAIGMGLADILSGYYYYAPFTFVIKGIVALIAFQIINVKNGTKKDNTAIKVIAFSAAELFMVAGYYLTGFALAGQLGGSKTIIQRLIYASQDIIPNLFQATAGVILGIILSTVISKTKISKYI